MLYDRVPEPPPAVGPARGSTQPLGNDANTAGHDDSSLGRVRSGFAFGHGGVFVLQCPHLQDVIATACRTPTRRCRAVSGWRTPIRSPTRLMWGPDPAVQAAR